MLFLNLVNVEIKNLPKSEVEITGEIPAENFEQAYQKALKEFNEKATIPGFRAGHIPENILIEKIGSAAILERAAELILQEAYPKILQENKIEAIGHPHVTITKIARNNPLGFKAVVAILPKVVLPDYKKIAFQTMQKKDEITVEEKEIDEAIEFIRKSQKVGKELPEINDETRKILRENIAHEKTMRAREKKRMEVLEKVSAQTAIDMPDILIESEKNKMIGELKSSIEHMGLKWPDYLSHIKKTEEELQKEWSGEAARRARYALILREIANQEKIDPSAEELEDFTQKMLTQYPETERAKIDKSRLKDYAYGILRNEKIFQFLENSNG